MWKKLKHDVVDKLPSRTLAEMKTAITAGVQRLQERSDIIKGFFKDPDLTYIKSADQAAQAKSTSRIPA